MQGTLHLQAVTRDERHQAIESIRRLLDSCGAWIVDFSMFSNISISVRFEIPANRIGELRAGLIDLGWCLISAGEPADTESGEKEIEATLNLLFIHDDPDLRIPIPHIPG